MKFLTFLSKEEIECLEEKNKVEPHLREAHKTLAHEVIKFIHGEDAYQNALKISEALFSGKVNTLNAKEIEQAFADFTRTKLEEEKNIVDLLVEIKAASSKREGRQFVENGAVSINGEINKDITSIIGKNNAIEGKYIVIRRGKKNYYLVEC